jgi:hypothetical protein
MMRRHPAGVSVALSAVVSLLLFAPVAAGNEEFGIASLASRLESGGSAVRQAGSHPETMTTAIIFNRTPNGKTDFHGDPLFQPYGSAREIEASFPPGLIFNPTATKERCTEEQLQTPNPHVNEEVECPTGSAVGSVFAETEIFDSTATLYNMIPPPGVSAEFAVNLAGLGIIAHIVGALGAHGGYHITADTSGIIQRNGFSGAVVTINGFPSGPSGTPLMTMPTGCGGTLTTTVKAESWQEESASKEFTPLDNEDRPLTVTGCDHLKFEPELRVQPTTHRASWPSGLDVEMSVPQEEGSGLAHASLKEAVVTLPPGFTVNTSAAAGLEACSPQQIGLGNTDKPSCPDASKVGAVEIVTPLLGPERPLHGSVYLAQQGNAAGQGENPFKNLIALYLVAEVANIVVKIPGEVSLDPATGRITTRFGEDPAIGSFLPQAPFSHVKIDLFGGEHAALATPSQCGTYTVTSQLTPWSAPESGPPATPNSNLFAIDENCHGGEFAPSFIAGTESNIAGSFSPFISTFKREGGEAELGQVQIKLPPGLLANVGSVPLCGEPQAQQGECPPASRIGHVVTGVGVGSSPFYVSGEVFLTGPYNGAPYGLAIEVPAIAGPFNLDVGNRPIVVRAALSVDPYTAAATVTTGPLPRILQGIPLQVRTVTVTTDRPGFTFNPTSCTPLAITATVTGTSGQSAPLSSRFQAANCATLAFKPKFSVSTSGKTSRSGGASLDTKLSYPPGSQGAEANIHSVKVELPKQLPSRLTTLQKACPAQVFEANPATCPPASIVGIVKTKTPILSVTLSGPVYFVSHGGEAFPSLEVILQGNGIRADLVGTTFISMAGITSSTFKEIPDVPVESFELYLPQGKYSALAANGNLCKTSLKMPTTFVAQNGTEIKQTTPITVTGCPKKATKKAKKAGAARRRGAAKRA